MAMALAAMACGEVAAGPLTLAENGRSAYSIYHEAGAPASVARAARELQRVIELSTGARLSVVTQPATPMIALGETAAAREAGLTREKIPFEGFVILRSGANVLIAGHDVPEGQERWQWMTSDGTLYGANTFLERVVGVRWLMPGDVGEDVPRQAKLTVDALDIRQAPVFGERSIAWVNDKVPSVIAWKERHKMYRWQRVGFGHSWDDYPAVSVLQAHPEYMRMREDGLRDPPPAKKDPAVLFCLSQPGLVQALADGLCDELTRHPKRWVGSLSSSDGFNGCHCPECLKLRLTDDGGKWHNFGGYGESISPLLLRFYNQAARIVAQKCPDRIVGGYVYRNYQYPPDPMPKMEPNLVLDIAMLNAYGYKLYKPERASELGPMVDAWAGSGARLAWTDYSTWYRNGYGVPLPPGAPILKMIFPLLAKHRAVLVAWTGHEHWGSGALHNYVVAKLLWDPGADVDALCAEFQERAYGPDAAPAVARIYALVEEGMMQYIRSYGNKPRDPVYNVNYEFMQRVCAPRLAEIEKLYAEAMARTGTEPQRRRLEMLGDMLVVLHYNLRKASLAGAKPEASPLYKDDAAYREFLAARADSISLETLCKLGKDGLLNVLAAADKRAITVPRLAAGFAPPKVDGGLDDPAWEEAAIATDFRLRNTRSPASQQTFVRLCYDDKALYIGVECRDARAKEIRIAAAGRDSSGVFQGDTFELFIGSKQDYLDNYLQIALSPGGGVYDGVAGEKAYNFDFRSAVKAGEQAWTAEIAIPFASFGLAEAPAGKTWRANFCRVRQPEPSEVSSWNAIDKGFHEPKNFGTWNFAGK
jgi:hypothetical protein